MRDNFFFHFSYDKLFLQNFLASVSTRQPISYHSERLKKCPLALWLHWIRQCLRTPQAVLFISSEFSRHFMLLADRILASFPEIFLTSVCLREAPPLPLSPIKKAMVFCFGANFFSSHRRQIFLFLSRKTQFFLSENKWNSMNQKNKFKWHEI